MPQVQTKQKQEVEVDYEKILTRAGLAPIELNRSSEKGLAKLRRRALFARAFINSGTRRSRKVGNQDEGEMDSRILHMYEAYLGGEMPS